ncbi:conserved Plasmodium protein, unknown function [Plasmodium malariae]|uniref:PUB domain-containing protein n=1 Tax=Plasmodium malariae TaxID=5858 RepID=A0A1A8WAJ4_PLAMA|nr:conserved Plasmodium protein, unknown function [Plasmodium malariae]SBS90033.1 hypothetical protein PMALA_028330 [Plasmodium malariae]SCP03157.1 conserved Plasmodium protein, unknown function [Plasmodium malariae]
MYPENEVERLILLVGEKINKSAEQLKPFIKLIVEENWIDSLESLKNLSDDEWNRLRLPIRLVDEIKRELGLVKGEDKKKENDELSESNSPSRNKNKKNDTLIINKKMKKEVKDDVKYRHGQREDSEKSNNNFRKHGISINSNFEQRIHTSNLCHNKKVERKCADMSKLENKSTLNHSVIKCNMEKLEYLIKNDVKDIQKEDVFYLSYENDNSGCISYSEEKVRTINSINETEKLKIIDINDLKSIIPILCKIVKNILINPNIINTRILKSTNDIMKNKILKYKETKIFLLSIGFVQMHTFYVMERVDTLLLLCVYESLQNVIKDTIKISSPLKATFDPFKSNIICVDNLKKGELKSDEQIDKLLKNKKEQVEKLMNQSVELNPKIYLYNKSSNINAIERSNGNNEANEGGNDTTNTRAHAAENKGEHIVTNKIFNSYDSDEDESTGDLTHLIPNIKNLYKEQTFKSKTKLELEKISSRKMYYKSVLKILFPDSYVLEMSFSAGTLIKEVNANIKKFLNNSVASREWYIYETPGICKFDPHKKLSDYNLIPHALLRFKVDDKCICSGDSSFLSEEAIAKYFFKS